MVQIQQESSVVLAQGGGLSLYFQQKRDGFVPKWLLENVTKVSSFVRERQELKAHLFQLSKEWDDDKRIWGADVLEGNDPLGCRDR